MWVWCVMNWPGHILKLEIVYLQMLKLYNKLQIMMFMSKYCLLL